MKGFCFCGHERRFHAIVYGINKPDGMCEVKGCDCGEYRDIALQPVSEMD